MSDSISITEIRKLCRVCLTKSQAMIPIETALCKDTSVLAAIERVMSVKLLTDDKFPSMVCGMCKGLLKIAYDLNVIFHRTQATLSQQLEEAPIKEDCPDSNNEVELIFGKNKYNLNDVLIVEEEKEEDQNFDGFLNNLGKSVSAIFASKSKRVKLNYNQEPSTQIEVCKRVETGETIIDLSLDELQGSNINDLFPDLQYENELDIFRKIYKCDSCNIFCANKSHLKSHLRKHHSEEVPYFCEICASTSFTSKDSEIQNPDVINCDECGSINSKIRILDVKCSNQKEYLCQDCGYITRTLSSLRYHQLKHSEGKWECPFCLKKYRTKSSLKNHIDCHSNLRNYLCTVCGKKFNLSSALRYHMRTHTKEKRYICSYCAKSFSMSGSLTRHIRTHTGIRPYRCSYCEKSFFSMGEQRKHEFIHTGTKPFKCGYCHKAFTSSFNRQVHYMAHAGPHTCEFCSRTFIEMEFLKKHLQTKHEVSE